MGSKCTDDGCSCNGVEETVPRESVTRVSGPLVCAIISAWTADAAADVAEATIAGRS